ncbi:alpha/beta hydrolase fold domain-containing protein [Acuticoccus sp. M5D2P5]|uniref:alpha/beta hydrolase n=1 Tax=Acuticoccus kalidii TaxID=2910977 RepID=UPI001F2365BD|nr:alpha/beta hydrolase [Acuticoccus kalidii]MCF3933399.1 alpha/beta hydrolase fold domain-containing protein [Acuticoccus kalidii]
MTEPLYRGMDRAELDRQYTARATVPNVDLYIEAYATRTAEAKAATPRVVSLPYGPSADETLDIYPVERKAATPVFVFIHGGYWRALSKDHGGFMAPTLARDGIATVSLNYALAPSVRLEEIVAQCRRALAFLHREGAHYGLDPDRIIVGGSSAGGHLTGMMLTGNWFADYGVPADLVKAAMPVSGLMDIEPMRLCHVNDWLDLDAARAAALSPQHLVASSVSTAPVVAAVGGTETEEFRRQTHDFAAAWRHAGRVAMAREVPERNHFDVIFDLADPATPLYGDLIGLFRAIDGEIVASR